MYKIYINETVLYICSVERLNAFDVNDESVLQLRYRGVKKVFFNALDTAEKSNNYRKIVIVTEDISKTWKEFKSLFVIIEAAGGIVLNPNNKVLMIYRRLNWDLPKGKIEKKEGKKAAAIREVEEETGVKNLKITQKLDSVYHIYKDKHGSRVLKLTYWYEMQAPKQPLVPQIEEDIELARWKNLEKFLVTGPVTYRSISDLLWSYYLGNKHYGM